LKRTLQPGAWERRSQARQSLLKPKQSQWLLEALVSHSLGQPPMEDISVIVGKQILTNRRFFLIISSCQRRTPRSQRLLTMGTIEDRTRPISARIVPFLREEVPKWIIKDKPDNKCWVPFKTQLYSWLHKPQMCLALDNLKG
jgi:hypothetical protein